MKKNFHLLYTRNRKYRVETRHFDMTRTKGFAAGCRSGGSVRRSSSGSCYSTLRWSLWSALPACLASGHPRRAWGRASTSRLRLSRANTQATTQVPERPFSTNTTAFVLTRDFSHHLAVGFSSFRVVEGQGVAGSGGCKCRTTIETGPTRRLSQPSQEVSQEENGNQCPRNQTPLLSRCSTCIWIPWGGRHSAFLRIVACSFSHSCPPTTRRWTRFDATLFWPMCATWKQTRVALRCQVLGGWVLWVARRASSSALWDHDELSLQPSLFQSIRGTDKSAVAHSHTLATTANLCARLDA